MPARLYNAASSTLPTSPSSTSATAGVAGTYARGDHVHPASVTQPADHGFLAWNFDIGSAGNTALAIPASGTIVAVKIPVPAPILVTNIHLWLTTQGATLTSGQNFVALYGTSKELLSVSSDQTATGFVDPTGLKTMTLTAPQSITAGTYYVAIWSNGTTRPSFRTASNLSSANANLSAATSRWATANTSITTTAPPTLGTFTALAGTYWVGLT